MPVRQVGAPQFTNTEQNGLLDIFYNNFKQGIEFLVQNSL